MELIRSSALEALELSERECEKIVRKAAESENVKILKAKIENFGLYLGFLGEYFRLEIEAIVDEEKRNFKFFMKSLPISDMKQRKMLEDTGIFAKEVKLYETLLPDLAEFTANSNRWCSRAFLARNDLLILDDLSLEGYKIFPFQFKFDQAHVEVTLKALASFHSSSIAYEEKQRGKGKSIKEKFDETLFETSVMDCTWFHAGLKVKKIFRCENKLSCLSQKNFFNFHSQTIYDIALNETNFGKAHCELIKSSFYDKIFGIIETMEKSTDEVPFVLCHRDLWCNNLMFKLDENSNPVHCIFIDFQTARYLSLTVDVVMAIICTTRRENHERLFEHYINYYYEQLQKCFESSGNALNSIMTRESFIKGCKFHKPWALVYNLIVLMNTSMDREYFVDFTEDQYRDFAEGNRSKFVFDYMQKDSFYKECLVEAVEAVLEHFYKNS